VLDGRVALVVGASRGIGLAIGAALGEAGAEVVLTARNPATVDSAAEQLRSRGIGAYGVAADATIEAELDEVLRFIEQRWSRLDVLVNNVGVAPFASPIADTRPRGFATNLDRNLMPVVNALHAAEPLLRRSDAGCVLTIASTGALIPCPDMAYYGAAKAASVSLNRTAALEWAPNGIRVNVLAPGWVRTDLSARQHEDAETSSAIVTSIPLGRWGEPADIADAALFLCSHAARYITGAILVVDGGLTLQGAVTS
jgi:3-oxoacyl-[acyl-carrier protein] reductase